jgi:SAM-dependent methyltransferase/aminoglycoside phosphotransferase (APT) family kinase protein
VQNVAHQGDLRCPRCLGNLEAGRERLRCRSCRTEYPAEDGIIDLRTSPGGRQPHSADPTEMETLAREMTADTWAATIREVVRHAGTDTGRVDDIVSDARYAWKLLLDLHPNAVVLDIGCGFGGLTHNIAPFVRKTYALELDWPRLTFSMKRFSLFNPGDDITLIAGGDGPHLPFRDGALDCVVMPGVLERVGEGDMTAFTAGSPLARLWSMLASPFGVRSPRRAQLGFLREIRRVLKPAGQVFIAAANRLSHGAFPGGHTDRHSGVEPLLPRIAANLYSMAVRRSPYRAYTYTMTGYRRLLNDAGFPQVEFVGLSRSYREVRELLPADIHAPAWRSETPATLRERIRRNRHFHPDYGVLGGAAPQPWHRLQDAVLAAVQRALAGKIGAASLAIRSYMVSGKDKVMLMCEYGGRGIIVKIPLNRAATSAEARNHDLLARVAANGALAPYAPAALAAGSAQGLGFFVEQRLPGAPLVYAVIRTGHDALLEQVAQLLDGLHPAQSATLCPLEGVLYEREVLGRLDRVLPVIEDDATRERVTAFFRNRLQGIPATFGLCHGDFGTRNLLAHEGRLSGLVDWEGGSFEGLPILDVLNYLTSAHLVRHPRDRLDQVIPLLASGRWPHAGEARLLADRCAALRTGPAHHEAWTYLYWLHCVDMQLQVHLQYSPANIARQVGAVVRALPR